MVDAIKIWTKVKLFVLISRAKKCTGNKTSMLSDGTRPKGSRRRVLSL